MVAGLAHITFLVSSWLLQHVFVLEHTTEGDAMYFDAGYVAINSGCSGLKLFYQFTFLMLFFLGPWKKKLWYIPMGVFIVFLTNLFRIIILSYTLYWWPEQWDFVHTWILRPFFYVVIFALWVYWVEKNYACRI